MFTRQNYLSGLNVGTEKRAAAFSLLIEQIAVVVCTTKCDAPTRTRKVAVPEEQPLCFFQLREDRTLCWLNLKITPCHP